MHSYYPKSTKSTTPANLQSLHYPCPHYSSQHYPSLRCLHAKSPISQINCIYSNIYHHCIQSHPPRNSHLVSAIGTDYFNAVVSSGSSCAAADFCISAVLCWCFVRFSSLALSSQYSKTFCFWPCSTHVHTFPQGRPGSNASHERRCIHTWTVRYETGAVDKE